MYVCMYLRLLAWNGMGIRPHTENEVTSTSLACLHQRQALGTAPILLLYEAKQPWDQRGNIINERLHNHVKWHFMKTF